MNGMKTRVSTASILVGVLCLSGCSALTSVGNVFSSSSDAPVGQVGNVPGFLGGVVADEPQAALVGRTILSAGGNAADAAAAIGFTLAVTLPSRAGLGSGGACLVFNPAKSGPGGGLPEAILFPSTAPADPGRADRPAGTPMLARGLFALQARYGKRPMETLVVPAEQFARFGVAVSRALVRDLAVVAGPLSADPGARAVFFPNGAPLAEGSTMVQQELGGTLAQLRIAGVGDLYQGLVAKRLEDGMIAAGGGLTVSDLRASLPRYAAPMTRPAPNGDIVSVLPQPEAGGVATLAAAEMLLRGISNGQDLTAQARERSINVAAAARRGSAMFDTLLTADVPAGDVGPLPASTVFGAIDRDGGAVICGTSMGNLFGTGRIAPGTGILLGVSPARAPQPLLAISMLTSSVYQGFRAMSGGSGQEAAPIAAAMGLVAGATNRQPTLPPEPGRANTIGCPALLPANPNSCAWSVDPRSLGLAAGSN